MAAQVGEDMMDNNKATRTSCLPQFQLRLNKCQNNSHAVTQVYIDSHAKKGGEANGNEWKSW